MTYNSVQLLLKNRRYIGEFRFRDTVIPDGIPAIVPQELFDRVQEKMAKPRLSEEQIRHWLLLFRGMDMQEQHQRKMLIDTFINAIYLYDDKVVITFNYKEGEKTITFADVQEAVDRGDIGSDLDCLGAPKLLQ